MVVGFFSRPRKVSFSVGALAVLFDDAGALHEHAAGTAGRIEHRAALGVDDVGHEGDQRNRRKELAVVVGLFVGELSQEVLVDAGHSQFKGPVGATADAT
jgi:hypothetical protein